MGNLPKNSKWRTNGDPGIAGPGLEARPAVLGNRGKMGKNARNDDSHGSPTGVQHAPYYLVKSDIR